MYQRILQRRLNAAAAVTDNFFVWCNISTQSESNWIWFRECKDVENLIFYVVLLHFLYSLYIKWTLIIPLYLVHCVVIVVLLNKIKWILRHFCLQLCMTIMKWIKLKTPHLVPKSKIQNSVHRNNIFLRYI